MRMFLAAAMSGAAFATIASAQPAPNLNATMHDAQAAQLAAQAQAAHPGDETLNCDQLQSQLAASMADPSVTANISALGQQAQTTAATAQKKEAEMTAQAAAQSTTNVLMTLIPGAGLLHHAPQPPPGPSQAEITEANRQSAQMTGDVNAMMPQMMRGQHLYQLAQDKKCAFLNDPSAAPVPSMH